MSESQIVFTALVLPESLRREVILRRDEVLEHHGIRPNGFEREEKLHITIRYFGEVDQDTLKDIYQSTGSVTGAGSFQVVFTGFSVLYHRRIPKILYASVQLPPAAFAVITNLEEQYCLPGFQSEFSKAFVPHITVKRIRQNGDEGFIGYFPNSFDHPKSFMIDTVAVYESMRTGMGSTYRILKTFNLEG